MASYNFFSVYYPGDRIRRRIHSDMTKSVYRLWSKEVKKKTFSVITEPNVSNLDGFYIQRFFKL